MSQATVRYFQTGQIVFYEGISDDGLYKVISGSFAFYRNYGTAEEQMIGVCTAPHYFGAMNALSGKPSGYTAVAAETATALYLPQEQLETFPKSDPAGALALMRTLACEAYGALAESGKIVDHYEEPIRPIRRESAVDESAARTENSPPTPQAKDADNAVGQIMIGDMGAKRSAVQMPEPYLEGHGSYPGITRPEDRKYLFEQELTCPHCRKKFKTERAQISKLIPIRDSAEEKRYDLRVTYRDFELEWHEVVTCPHCFFSSFDNYFHDSKSLYRSRYESDMARLLDYIAFDPAAEKDLDMVFAQHYLAMVCARGFTDSRQIIARLWMNLTRLYIDAGEPALSDQAERNALDAYQKVYMEVELTQGQEQRLCLTVAGILYARGDKKAAREWAMRVRSGSGDHSAYWGMAEQLIQDVRAELES